ISTLPIPILFNIIPSIWNAKNIRKDPMKNILVFEYKFSVIPYPISDNFSLDRYVRRSRIKHTP
ncbi:MAG: hypothetical protein ACK56F_30655, partial [bacterium]